MLEVQTGLRHLGHCEASFDAGPHTSAYALAELRPSFGIGRRQGRFSP
jgi:hypothetical protein